MEPATQEALLQKFPGLKPRCGSADWTAFNVPMLVVLPLLRHLRDEGGYDSLTDLTALDNGVGQNPRFTVVWHLYSTRRHDYLRLAADCLDEGAPSCPSACELWAGANWHERECYDMFGIVFSGHPDLRRILMWDGYPYYPLRKDFPLAGLDTDLPAADVAAETGVRVEAAPMMGGPFFASSGQPMSVAEPRATDQSWTEKHPKPEAS